MRRSVVWGSLGLCLSCAHAEPAAVAPNAHDEISPPSSPAPSSASAAQTSAPTETANACEPESSPEEAPSGGPIAFEAEDGLYGYKAPDGKVVVPARFQQAYAFNAQGLAGAVLDNAFVFIGRDGKVLAKAFPYDNGPDYFQEGRARILEGGKFGFIDKRGQIVIAPQFDFASPFCRGRAAVCSGCKAVAHGEHTAYEGGRWGFIDEAGKLVIPLDYDEVTNFASGTAEVSKAGQRSQIDAQGKPVPTATTATP